MSWPSQPFVWRLAFISALALTAVSAHAEQALERHLPSQPTQQPARVTIAPEDFGEASAEPFGVDLSGIHMIGKDDAVASNPAKGLSGLPERISTAEFSRTLTPFVGQPLSLKLASDIQAAIAKAYRDAGYPFVSVTLPPQELTGGVLQVRVIEFSMGGVTMSGTSTQRSERIKRGIRTVQNEPIDARAVDEDLTWLNRSPFLGVEGSFQPGDELGLSNLELSVTESKPWQVYWGWSNTGSSAGDANRYSLGGSALLPALNDAWFSYQLTANKDVWSDLSRIFPGQGNYPGYVSHSGNVTIPTLPRQSLEISPVFVASRQQSGALIAFENTTVELPVIYRSAVSNLLSEHYWGDVYGGFEFKKLYRRTYFNNAPVASGQAGLFQFVLGWNKTFTDHLGNTYVDLRIKANPGGVLAGNTSAAWSTFTSGRVTKIPYAYGAFDIVRNTTLPARMVWASKLTGQIASHALPNTEQISLGGMSAVRGYTSDSASADAGLVWRNELRLPTVSPLANTTGKKDILSPFAFADLAFGIDQSTKAKSALAGVGLGIDYSIGQNFTANLVAGFALKGAGTTNAGDFNLQANLVAKF